MNKHKLFHNQAWHSKRKFDREHYITNIIFITSTKWKVSLLQLSPMPVLFTTCSYCAIFHTPRLLTAPSRLYSVFLLCLPFMLSILIKARWHLNKGYMTFPLQCEMYHLDAAQLTTRCTLAQCFWILNFYVHVLFGTVFTGRFMQCICVFSHMDTQTHISSDCMWAVDDTVN